MCGLGVVISGVHLAHPRPLSWLVPGGAALVPHPIGQIICSNGVISSTPFWVYPIGNLWVEGQLCLLKLGVGKVPSPRLVSTPYMQGRQGLKKRC